MASLVTKNKPDPIITDLKADFQSNEPSLIEKQVSASTEKHNGPQISVESRPVPMKSAKAM